MSQAGDSLPIKADKPAAETSTNQPAIAVEGEEWIPEAEMWQKLGLPSKEALRKRRNRQTLPANVEGRKNGQYWEYRFV